EAARRALRGAAPGRDYPRYWQGGCSGSYPAQAGSANTRGTKNHGTAYRGWRTDMLAVEIVSTGAADYPSPPRETRWVRLPRRIQRRGHSTDGPDTPNG